MRFETRCAQMHVSYQHSTQLINSTGILAPSVVLTGLSYWSRIGVKLFARTFMSSEFRQFGTHDKTCSLWYSLPGSSATKVTHSPLVKLPEATSPCHNKILSFSWQVHHKVTGTIAGCAGVESWGPYNDSRYGIWNMQEALLCRLT